MSERTHPVSSALSAAALPFPPLPSFSISSLTPPPSLPSSSSPPPSTYSASPSPSHPSPLSHLPTPTPTYPATNSASTYPSPDHHQHHHHLPPHSLHASHHHQHPHQPQHHHPHHHHPHAAETRYPPFTASPSPPHGAPAPTAAAAADLYAQDLHGGYIRILPRTSTASALYKKRCETCATTHDGSFGAGRFCSSRCARTVGGLAHRKKRMMERDAKQRSAAEQRAKIKKRRFAYDGAVTSPSPGGAHPHLHMAVVSSTGMDGGGGVSGSAATGVTSGVASGSGTVVGVAPSMLTDEALVRLGQAAEESASCAAAHGGVAVGSGGVPSPRTVMTINSLLNPAES